MITCVKVLEDGTEERSSAGSIVVSCAILALFNFCPIIFLRLMHKHRLVLDKLEIRQKIGTLYNGLNPMKPKVASYSATFLVRRTAFVAITFALSN